MTCGDVQEALEPFVDGELPGAPMREIARHLAACRPCEAMAVELEEAQGTLRRAVIGAVGEADTAAAWAAVSARLDDATPTLTRRACAFLAGLQIPGVPMPVLIGGVAVALLAFLFWRDGDRMPGEPGTAQQLAAHHTRIDELDAPGSVRVWNPAGTGATVIWVDEEGLSVEHLDP